MRSDVREGTSKRRTEMFLLNLPTQYHSISGKSRWERH